MKHTEKPAVEPEPSWEEFRRVKRRDIDVRIKIAINNNGVQTYVYGRGNDIAEGGMAAYISMEMSIGARVKMEVQLPYSQQPLKIVAAVRNRHGFRYGMEFTTVSDQDRENSTRACPAISLVQYAVARRLDATLPFMGGDRPCRPSSQNQSAVVSRRPRAH